MKRICKGILVLSLGISLNGCVSMHLIANEEQSLKALSSPEHGSLKVGNDVLVKTRDGREFKLEVLALSDEGLRGKREGKGGEEVSVDWKDMQSVHREELDRVNTTLLTSVIAAGVVALIVSMARSMEGFGHMFDGAGSNSNKK